jgi:hypothetical protein
LDDTFGHRLKDPWHERNPDPMAQFHPDKTQPGHFLRHLETVLVTMGTPTTGKR